ncbi:MAG: hypothetical protein HN948_04320 [Clostridia bacterium]|jgi:hypothetical protein|nr:hypothetical protein [Clostridia bacterium]MBT7122221.1 hypothetical protein [Clostridia bacterium]
MEYNVKDFPAHLTLVGEMNGQKAYAAAGREVRAYPPFVTAPQTVAGSGELRIASSFVDVVVFPELFVVVGSDVQRGQGCTECILGFGISLAMREKSMIRRAGAKGGTPRDIACCTWYQMQANGTHVIGDVLVEKLDIDKCKMTLGVDGKEKTFDMADMIWTPDNFFKEMSQLVRFKRNDMVFLGPVDEPMSLDSVTNDTVITVTSNCFDDLEVAVKFE